MPHLLLPQCPQVTLMQPCAVHTHGGYMYCCDFQPVMLQLFALSFEQASDLSTNDTASQLMWWAMFLAECSLRWLVVA